MAIKANNHVVAIEYELTEAGKSEVIDSNKGSMPLEFIIGMGQIIPGLEAGLVGMSAGDSAKITVKPEDAYGKYNEDALKNVPIEHFEGIDLKEGMTLYGRDENGQQIAVRVKSFNDKEVLLDYNHELAGKELVFDVTVISERDATYDEMATGVVGGYANCSTGGWGW